MKIKSFEGACKVLKRNPKKLPIVTGLPKKHAQAIVDHFKLITITEAINGDWKADWNNPNQYKYYAWFYMVSSGFGFSFSAFVFSCAGTGVGSRLCFKSAEDAKYAAIQFKKLYKSYLLIQ